jgi:hypothetical protein
VSKSQTNLKEEWDEIFKLWDKKGIKMSEQEILEEIAAARKNQR